MALICLFILAVVAVAAAIFYQRKSEYLQSMVADLQDSVQVADSYIHSLKEYSDILNKELELKEKEIIHIEKVFEDYKMCHYKQIRTKK